MDIHKLNLNIGIVKYFLIIYILILHSISIVSCRSSTNSYKEVKQPTEALEYSIETPDFRRAEKCHKDDDLMELCQRCAKATKSPIVFPMCCSDEDNAKKWCIDYVYYGID